MNRGLIFDFGPFCFASPEIIGVKVCNRLTNSLAPYTGACGFFLSVKFATSLLASPAGGLSVKMLNFYLLKQKLVEKVSGLRAGGQTKGLKTGHSYHTAKKKAGNPEHFHGSPNKSLGCKI